MCVLINGLWSPAWTLVTCIFRDHPPSVMIGLIVGIVFIIFSIFFLHFSWVRVENVTVYYSRVVIKWRRGAHSMSAWVRCSWRKKNNENKNAIVHLVQVAGRKLFSWDYFTKIYLWMFIFHLCYEHQFHTINKHVVDEWTWLWWQNRAVIDLTKIFNRI